MVIPLAANGGCNHGGAGYAAYCRDHPGFAVIGERMMAVWDDGVRGMNKNAR